MPTKTAPKKPVRADTDKPSPKGTGGASGASDGATKTSAAPPTKTHTSTPTKVRTSTPTKGTSSTPTKTRPTTPRPGATMASKYGVASPTKARPASPLSDRAKELALLAAKTKDGSHLNPFDSRAWDPKSDDLTDARNAHHSNTPAEMRDALENGYNWLEGDLRLNSHGVPVMAHDSSAEADGLTLDEWIKIGGAGERGLKIDVKETEAIEPLLAALEASDIPEGRIMLNVSTSQVDEVDVRDMRRRFPEAWLALNPSPGDDNDYGPDDLKKVTDLADAAGGRVAFPLRWDLVDQGVIDTLRPHGKVSIWTSKAEGTPDHPGRETRKLRDMGVEGVIDFGPPQSTLENLAERGLDIWESGPVTSARDFIGGIPGAFGDAWDGVKNLGGWFGDRGNDVLDFGGDVLSTAGDFGGDVLEGAGDLGGDILEGGGDLLEGAGDIAEDLPLVGGLFD